MASKMYSSSSCFWCWCFVVFYSWSNIYSRLSYIQQQTIAYSDRKTICLWFQIFIIVIISHNQSTFFLKASTKILTFDQFRQLSHAYKTEEEKRKPVLRSFFSFFLYSNLFQIEKNLTHSKRKDISEFTFFFVCLFTSFDTLYFVFVFIIIIIIIVYICVCYLCLYPSINPTYSGRLHK